MNELELTDVKIITKQIIINTPTSSHLIPITADEKGIQKIQDVIDEHEELKKDVKRYIFLDHKNSFELTEAESGEWISLFKKIGLEYEPFKTKELFSKAGKEE